MENQTPEKVEPVAAAPVAKAKKSRMSNRTKNRLMFGVVLAAAVLFAYNGGYLQKAGTKAKEAIAAISPASFGFGTASATKAEDKLAAARGAFAAGDINAAIEGYRAYIAANPKSIPAHGELGNVLYTVGAVSEASQEYFEAASLAVEQNQIEVAEALVPAVIEGDPMLANALIDKLFDHQVRSNQSQGMQPAPQQAEKQG